MYRIFMYRISEAIVNFVVVSYMNPLQCMSPSAGAGPGAGGGGGGPGPGGGGGGGAADTPTTILTTYTCRGWADTPTTILLDTPSRPIGDQLGLGVHPLVLILLCRDRV